MLDLQYKSSTWKKIMSPSLMLQHMCVSSFLSFFLRDEMHILFWICRYQTFLSFLLFITVGNPILRSLAILIFVPSIPWNIDTQLQILNSNVVKLLLYSCSISNVVNPYKPEPLTPFVKFSAMHTQTLTRILVSNGHKHFDTYNVKNVVFSYAHTDTNTNLYII